MTRKPFLDFFTFLKNCPYDSNYFPITFLQQVRVQYVQWHQNRMDALNKRNYNSHKETRKCQLCTLSIVFQKKRQICWTKFSTVILPHFRVPCVQWHQNPMSVIWYKAKLAPKWPKNHFWTFSVLSINVLTIRVKFPIAFLHHIRVLYVQWHQNRRSVIWQTAKSIPEMTKKTFLEFFNFLEYCLRDSN